MKVKELRSWLADFGEKNQQHFNRGADPAQFGNAPSEVTSRGGPEAILEQPEDAFCIQTIPSNASTTPSSAGGDDLSPTLLAPTPPRWSDVEGERWIDGRLSPTSPSLLPYDEECDSSRQSSTGTSRSDSGRRSASSNNILTTPPKYSIHNTRKANIHEQAPAFPGAIQSESQFEAPTVLRRRDAKAAPTLMHNADLFQNGMLTKATLDAICHDKSKSEESSHSIRTSDHSSEIESLKSFFSHESEGGSIAHGALVSKMAAVFLNDAPETQTLKKVSIVSTASQGIVTRKKVDPKDLAFLQPQVKAPKQPVGVMPPAPNTLVGKGIRRFDPPPQSIVAARKEELNQKFAESKAASHIKKVKWGISSKTGGYKKKFIIDKEHK